ncbi:MAG: shikimate kinase [Spirochaetaceae bacterium]|jgi:shikimate kinase|nr:shikimate kinase [Spirochaetaceae bacterium]
MVVLTGPKHSGKTSAGLALRDITGGDFIDVDAFIEEQEGCGVRELYRQGKDVFHEAEARAISLIMDRVKAGTGTAIIAAGGGIIDNEDAVKTLEQDNSVTVVYLEVSAATAWERIERAASNGAGLPAFLDTENPRETHAALYERRAEAYRKKADFTVHAEGKTPRQVAEMIAAYMRVHE